MYSKTFDLALVRVNGNNLNDSTFKFVLEKRYFLVYLAN